MNDSLKLRGNLHGRAFLLITGCCAILSSVCCGDDAEPLTTHCAACHNDSDAAGEFRLSSLGKQPDTNNLRHWLKSLDRVTSGEMPPTDSGATPSDRTQVAAYLQSQLRTFRPGTAAEKPVSRRLNNREFENSIRDVLMIEDIGTHLPTADLIGDSRHHGFDTHADTLGFSKFYLEQYLVAVRRIVDATILSGAQPATRRYHIPATEIVSAHARQNTNRPQRKGKPEGFDFLDPLEPAYLRTFSTAPASGMYRISIRCTGKDRGRYDADQTGIYDADPIRLKVQMGDRERIFDLPDEQIEELHLTEWLAAETRLRLHYPTDGLRLRANGNFKFQNAITGQYLKQHNPELYQAVVDNIRPTKSGRIRRPEDWHHWVDYWQGPRPRIFDVTIEGPCYDSWPPQRQIKLIGSEPQLKDAAQILMPIASRAWRRNVDAGDLDHIVRLVQNSARQVGVVEAFKEGIVAILVSPEFLLLNQPQQSSDEKFATRFSYFLTGTIPTADLRQAAAAGQLSSFDEVRAEVGRHFKNGTAESFLKEFPYAWLELNDINFMAPDPDHFRHYHRKRVSDDMISEVRHFFRYAVENNLPVTDLIAADYSFINADLATIYQVDDVVQDSRLRKYTFRDGRRGGLLGMGAFLTVTADSLSTSPIHRAVYVMENFLGLQPTPPPPDVEITEPDVREAATIKAILEKHRSDDNCASCHLRIDPYGYAFENFDSSGAWRDFYEVASISDAASAAVKKRRRNGATKLSIDAGASFPNGTQYRDISDYRTQMLSRVNQRRFVRCFITKLLTYATGAEPHDADFAAIDEIMAESSKSGHRIIETIAAVIDSSLFRTR